MLTNENIIFQFVTMSKCKNDNRCFSFQKRTLKIEIDSQLNEFSYRVLIQRLNDNNKINHRSFD